MNLARKLKQIATYWEAGAKDIYGAVTYSAPDTRICRWEDSAEEFIDKHGRTAISKARVFLDEDISLNGYLYLGTSAETNPTTLSGQAFEVLQIKRIPDIGAVKTLYVAFL